MTEDENKILVRIGQLIATIIESDPNGAFAYVEVKEMWSSASIFHDEGNRVVYYDPSRELGDAIEDLWYEREPEQRWGAMRYEIVDGQFSAEFDYPDKFNPDDDIHVRRERALKARYGDKPIYYPPPEDWHELTEDDLSGE
jgi:hypothetical protein